MASPAAAALPLPNEISQILRQLEAQAPEVLELGVRKIQTTAELQIAGMVLEWAAFLVMIGVFLRFWRSYRQRYLAAQNWTRSKDDRDRPDYPSVNEDVIAITGALIAGILLVVIIAQAAWYLPDQLSYIANARYYAVLELIHQIRG